jgi:hypothetical protein
MTPQELKAERAFIATLVLAGGLLIAVVATLVSALVGWL